MKRLVEFQVGDDTLMVEVEQPSGIIDVGALDDTPIKAQKTFEESVEKVKNTAAILIAKMKDLASSPDEVSIEFSIKLSAEAGIVLASGSVEANYMITLKWSKSN
jgi:Trypsin-co-occurring domain 1